MAKVRQVLNGTSFLCPALDYLGCLTCSTNLPSSHLTPSCMHTCVCVCEKYHSTNPLILQTTQSASGKIPNAGLQHHKFHSSKIWHVKNEQWWKIHEVSKQGQAPDGLSLPGWDISKPEALTSGPEICRDWFYTRFSENNLSVVSHLNAAWESVLVCLRCQHTVRNSHPSTECWGLGQSRAEAKTYPAVHQDSDKEGSGRGKFLAFPTFSAGKSWMEKPLLNVLTVPFRRTFQTFTQTLSLHRKIDSLFHMPTKMS